MSKKNIQRNLEFISLMRRDGRVSKLKMPNTVLNEIFIDWVQKDAASTFKPKQQKRHCTPL